MIKKCFKILAILLVLAIFFAATVYAKDFNFFISRVSGTNGKMWVTSNTRDRTADSWLIAISDDSTATFNAGKDVIGFRVWNADKSSAVSAYHRFTNHVTNYALPYTTVPDSGDTLWLRAQVDDTSYNSNFYIVGKWFT